MNATDTSRVPAALRTPSERLRIAVLLPCFNEAPTISKVVADYRIALPDAEIYVYDNCSTDETATLARAAGAIVREEPWPGKGNVVRRMFADIDADVYLMADGDGTYDAASAPSMIRRLLDARVDMVIGVRRGVYTEAHRRGHGTGNRMFNFVFARMFGAGFSDIFSGFRVFSRRFVKSFPAVSRGFEIETEIAVHCMQLRLPFQEVETPYGARVEGSVSKLRTVRDALRILRTFAVLLKEVRPVLFFGAMGIVAWSASLVLAAPLVVTYMQTGLVPRLPTAILVTGLVVLGAIAFTCGLILDSLARARLEIKRALYLGLPALPDGDAAPRITTSR